MMTSDVRYLSVVAALLALIAVAPLKAKLLGQFSGYGTSAGVFELLAESQSDSSARDASSSETPLFVSHAFDELKLEARSAVVWDVEAARAIFSKNEAEVRPLASLAKLVTAITAERIAETRPANERIVVMTPAALAEEGEDGFRAGEQFYFSDLRDAMLVKSSNDAASAIAAWIESIEPPPADAGAGFAPVFVNEMNRSIADIGLSNTYVLNSTGLDLNPERAGAYGTALDTARLFSWIIEHMPGILFATQTPSIDIASLGGASHHFLLSGDAVLSIPELIGVKTGFTDLAGGNIVLGWSAGGRHFVIAVLGSTREGRFSDALTLYQSTMDFVSGAR